MYQLISAAILGLVEGLTEFLPISSTGHLILVNRWFSFGQPFTKLFDIVIQSGAILAVIIFFWKDIWPSSWKFNELKTKWGTILAAFIPTALIGFLFADIAEKYLFNPLVVAAALVFYGIIFIILEKFKKEGMKDQVSYSDAILIGLVQALALVPGTSRSGATILGLLFLGYARPAAAKFSFLLAIPTLVAASGYSLLKYKAPISGAEMGYLAIGFFISLISAYFVIRWFLSYISRKDFIPFAWYRIVLGLVVILFAFWS
ncbi:MAG: undecaprenyl-diphosphate phosphatase [Patescibacteria group bacterium]|nr:undecaprenyl-diphosphate phosphatase [Patescibacteria group bacterium]